MQFDPQTDMIRYGSSEVFLRMEKLTNGRLTEDGSSHDDTISHQCRCRRVQRHS
jgi:hypothetical protein